MWLIVVLAIIIGMCIAFKKPSTFIYGFVTIDILFRICSYLSNNLFTGDLANALKTMPDNLLNLMTQYSTGLLSEIIIWFYIILYIILEVNLIRLIAKKK